MDHWNKPGFVTKRLEADSIWLEYGNRRVLQQIFLRIEVGQVAGLLGRNGCGKSSLLEIIYGIRSAQQSSVRVDGMYYNKLYQHRNLVAYLPQKMFIPGYLRVKDAFTLYQSEASAIHALFPDVSSMLPYRLSNLSGGQQRLIETIVVVTSPAPFLLLDEPFSNIMPLHVEGIKQLIQLTKQRKGILITDHFYRDILDVSDSVYFLTLDGRTILLQELQEQLRDFGYISR